MAHEDGTIDEEYIMGRLTPQDIREHEFKQSALGYGKEQVNQFLDEIAEELETLIRESNEIHVENKEARLALKTYINVEDSLKETLLLAQKTAQETLKNSQNEADTIIRKANIEKDALLFSAKEDLSEVQNEIRKLQATRDAMLIKLKGILRSNLEVLDDEFSSDDESVDILNDNAGLKDERIVDFSRADMMLEDLPEENVEPGIQIEESSEEVPSE